MKYNLSGLMQRMRVSKRLLLTPAILLLLPVLLAFTLIGAGLPQMARAAAMGDCNLMVPAHPLTAQGLMTPWVISNGMSTCTEADDNMSSVFVQAVIFDPATRQLSVYDPLVVTAGTVPAIMPVPVTLPQGAVVGIWGGGNDNVTHLVGPGAKACVNGLATPFGQFFYCNAPDFFRDIQGKVTPPPLGTANDGQPCPSVRDFNIVDMDQSDNVQTTYLVTPNGQTAQNTAANRAELIDSRVIKNPSDNRLLTNFVDPAIGCHPWAVPDLTDNGTPTAALALDEMQAAVYQAAPQALVPLGDPMTLEGGVENLTKTNLYRVGVDQPIAQTTFFASTRNYCQNIQSVSEYRWLVTDKAKLVVAPSPVPANATNLWTFMAQRLNATFGPGGLNCTALLGTSNPVYVTTNAGGVAIDATLMYKPPVATAPVANAVAPVAVKGGKATIDPVYVILVLIALVAGGMGAMGFLMFKMKEQLSKSNDQLAKSNDQLVAASKLLDAIDVQLIHLNLAAAGSLTIPIEDPSDKERIERVKWTADELKAVDVEKEPERARKLSDLLGKDLAALANRQVPREPIIK